ncbi:hypothetical protein [Swingsia samuiensis]|uniref:Uncharacterized protein n=1 Tax=Swingsia samuiensis TaxID=1293412 RepID=A0A4Y6UJE7_9PROT|nr:hypothetical protein [Swingsia samuiensis]QDH16940.1 hypothetical protein E3D00_04685 [Swingsia samuiensis]
MAHNYAKPLTEQVRIERVLSRIPQDWGIRVERVPSQGWKAYLHPPEYDEQEGMFFETLAEALEDIWRKMRR